MLEALSGDELHRLATQASADDVSKPERLKAFGKLVRHFQAMAYACAYAILGDFHLAQDAAQDAFLAAYRKLPDLREPKAFAGWLRRIVVNRCQTEIRSRRIPTVSLDAVEEIQHMPSRGDATDPDDAPGVIAALRALPEDQRMLLALHYIDKYSQKEIASFLGVTPGTVRMRLFRFRRKLSDDMQRGTAKLMSSFPLSDDFADLVIRKVASDADLTKAREMLSYIATLQPADFDSPASAEEAGIYMVGEEGSLTGAGYFWEVALGIGSTILPMARAREIAHGARGVPHPATVAGYGALFQLARKRGIHAAMVHGSQYDSGFCWFVPCFYYAMATMPVQEALAVRTSAKLEPASTDEQRAAERAFLLDPYGVKVHPPMTQGDILIVREHGQVTGYVRVNARLKRSDCQDLSDRRLDYTLVNEVTVRTRDAALAVIRLAGERTQQAGRDTVCLMHSHMTQLTQTMLSLGANYLFRRPCNVVALGAQMVAVLELMGMTRQLAREFQSRLSQSIHRDINAAFSIDLDGQTVAFQAQDGKLTLCDQPQAIHRRLPRWVITRLYVGYYSGQEVLEMGPLPWDRSDGIIPDGLELNNVPLTLPPAEALLFAALFPKLWPVAWPDMDVFSWLLGEPYPESYFSVHSKLSRETLAKIQTLRFPWLYY